MWRLKSSLLISKIRLLPPILKNYCQNNMEENKKISLPETILMTLIVGSADAFEVFSDVIFPIPVIGQIFVPINWFVDFFILALVQFWLIMKGGIGFRKQAVSLVGNIIELVPGLDILPIRTTTLLVAIYLINKSEQSESEPSTI